jgi:hypothetical protein
MVASTTSRRKKKLFLFDNHGSNLEASLTNFFIANNVVALTFPAHLTHKLQPLDLTVFSTFSAYIAESAGIKLKENNELTIEDYPSIIDRGWQKASDKFTVRSGWKKAGITEVIEKALSLPTSSSTLIPTAQLATTPTETSNLRIRDLARVGMVVTSSSVQGLLQRVSVNRNSRNTATPTVINLHQTNIQNNLAINTQNNIQNNITVNNNTQRRRRQQEEVQPTQHGQLLFFNYTTEYMRSLSRQ